MEEGRKDAKDPARAAARSGRPGRAALLALALAGLPFGAGCSRPSVSSGPVAAAVHAPEWPAGLPRRVAVLPLDGNPEVSAKATDLVAVGLLQSGFDVIERNRLDPVLAEMKFANSGLVDEASRTRLGALLGVEAVFVGSLTGKEKFYEFKNHLSLKMIEVHSGRVLWSAEVGDPRWFGAINKLGDSYPHAVAKALKLLRKDLKLKRK